MSALAGKLVHATDGNLVVSQEGMMMHPTLFEMAMQSERRVLEQANERRRVLHEMAYEATRRPSMMRRALHVVRRTGSDGIPA